MANSLPDIASQRTISVLFLQAEDGIRDYKVPGVQTCALPIYLITWRQDAFEPAGHHLRRGGERKRARAGCRAEVVGGGRGAGDGNGRSRDACTIGQVRRGRLDGESPVRGPLTVVRPGNAGGRTAIGRAAG